MASSTKTTNYELNQWADNDIPVWDDHNADNLKIDTAIKAIADIATGGPFELQKSFTHIQWRYVGESTWVNIVALADITGATGATGAAGTNGTNGTNGADGADGADGRGIVSILRTTGDGSAGSTDIYTVTYTSGTPDTITVYNGTDGSGSGDMSKSTYDTNNDGKVNSADDSDKLGGVAASLYALKTYVDAAVAALVDSSPSTLNTLNELAAALGDDPNFATTIATTIGGKIPKITSPTAGHYAKVAVDGTLTDGGALPTASTSAAGIVQLSSSTSSTSEALAATPKAIKDVSDAKLALAGGTMTGALVAQNNTNYTTAQVRNITLSTADPSGGGNGDVWIKYTA